MDASYLPYQRSGRHPKPGLSGFRGRSEHRRQKRINERRDRKVCFNCRESGHLVADCPKGQTSHAAVGVCFKCGSAEHSLTQCKLRTKDLPFAECFVCGAMGHLSRNCTENSNGCYPSGGACLICDSKSHLRNECPKKVDTEDLEILLPVMDLMPVSADQDVSVQIPTVKQTKAKVVKF